MELCAKWQCHDAQQGARPCPSAMQSRPALCWTAMALTQDPKPPPCRTHPAATQCCAPCNQQLPTAAEPVMSLMGPIPLQDAGDYHALAGERVHQAQHQQGGQEGHHWAGDLVLQCPLAALTGLGDRQRRPDLSARADLACTGELAPACCSSEAGVCPRAQVPKWGYACPSVPGA